MYLVTSVLCFSIASLFFAVVLLGARSPKHPKWAGDAIIAYFYAPLMVGLTAVGLLSFGHFLAALSQGDPRGGRSSAPPPPSSASPGGASNCSRYANGWPFTRLRAIPLRF